MYGKKIIYVFLALLALLQILKACESDNRNASEQISNNCPNRTCTRNNDCWSKKGIPEICICDLSLCGSVCVPTTATCPKLENPKNGLVNMKNQNVGGAAEFSCNGNYVLKGRRTLLCQANMKWSAPAPTCSNVGDKCFSAPFLRNTEIINVSTGSRIGKQRDDYSNGDVIHIACRPGYEDVNGLKVSKASCNGNKWQYTPLDCQRISCGPLPNITNAFTKYTQDMKFGSIAIQTCNYGYETRCSVEKDNAVIEQTVSPKCELTCDKNGKWSGSQTVCEPLRCPKLPEPVNGRIEGPRGNLIIGTRVMYFCDEGYMLVGTSVRFCQENGNWNGTDAYCKVLECPPIPRIKNADISGDSRKFKSKINIQCNFGYSPSKKPSILSCEKFNETVRWEPVEHPTCYLDCLLMPIVNGTFLNQPSFKNAMKVPHLTELEVKCDNGYEISDKVMSLDSFHELAVSKRHPICLNGIWSRNVKCLKASCKSRPPSLPNTTVKFFSRKHGAIARYECQSGFSWERESIARREIDLVKDIVNSNIYECKQGKWTGNVSKCIEVVCKKPKLSSDIKLLVDGKYPYVENVHRFSHGNKISFSCQNDKENILKGPHMAVCYNGKWFPRDIPTCQPKTHDEVPWEWFFFKNSSI